MVCVYIVLFNIIDYSILLKSYTKYLVTISHITYNKFIYNLKSKLVNFINLDKANPKYLIPIYPILFNKIFT